MRRVVVWDYGSGNLRSAARALERAGAAVSVGADEDEASGADGLVLPGVGAFGECMAGIVASGGARVVRDRLAAGAPVLGICVGMQVLFTRGTEHGQVTAGLGVLSGTVRRLRADVLPHIGWNLIDADGLVLLDGLADQRFYFVHSYAVAAADLEADGIDAGGIGAGGIGADAVAWAEHGERFVAAVEAGPLSATQFHPEKSGEAGLALLGNWVRGLG